MLRFFRKRFVRWSGTKSVGLYLGVFQSSDAWISVIMDDETGMP
jgi:hypothetical protein